MARESSIGTWVTVFTVHSINASVVMAYSSGVQVNLSDSGRSWGSGGGDKDSPIEHELAIPLSMLGEMEVSEMADAQVAAVLILFL